MNVNINVRVIGLKKFQAGDQPHRCERCPSGHNYPLPACMGTNLAYCGVNPFQCWDDRTEQLGASAS
jgi:hypothetical protein